MNDTEKTKIYDRMFDISLKVDPNHIPSPRMINENIGRCHIFMEEISKTYIQITQAISHTQRRLNNKTTDYEIKLDSLLATDEEILALPSSRDREARARTLLKNEILEIKDIQFEVNDLERLLKIVLLRQKDMTRANSDAKAQSKLLDSEIKLNGTIVPESLSREIEEKNRIFEEPVVSKITEQSIMDPTEPITAEDLVTKRVIITDEMRQTRKEICDSLFKNEPLPTESEMSAIKAEWQKNSVEIETEIEDGPTEDIDEPDIISEMQSQTIQPIEEPVEPEPELQKETEMKVVEKTDDDAFFSGLLSQFK
jgi:hypothetical protein